MSNRKITRGAVVFGLVLLALSVGYDFWRGYRNGGGVSSGIAFVIFGFIVLGIIGLMMWGAHSNN